MTRALFVLFIAAMALPRPTGAQVGPLNLPAEVQRRRQELAADPYRPHYHFVAPEYVLKDPNGLMFWKGRYHLFYQLIPYRIHDGSEQHWGHAVSKDLVHWRDLPIAVRPGKSNDAPDRGGCWSGTTVIVDGVPTAVYFGNPGGICIARAHPDDELLIHWDKFAGNPIIPQPPAGTVWRAFDPDIWKEGDEWFLISGGGGKHGANNSEGRGDTTFLLTSKDFTNWEYEHEFYTSDRKWTKLAEDCAVPDFFEIDGKHMLLFSSHFHGAQYYIGRYSPEDKKFYPESHDRLNHCSTKHVTMDSGNPIAPATWLTPDGQRIFISWLAEGLKWPEIPKKMEWAGILSLPRVFKLNSNGVLHMHPVESLKKLRHNHRRIVARTLPQDFPILLDEVRGNTFELEVILQPTTAPKCGVGLLRSPGAQEESLVIYNREKKTITLDVSKSSKNPDVVDAAPQIASLDLEIDEPLRLQIFVDRSVIEVFANDTRCLTKRVYPSRKDSLGVTLFALGGEAKLVSLDAWDLKAVWPTGK
jgi:beta-fructofuranosidase